MTTITLLTGTALGTMHVINRLVYYISTLDNKLNDKGGSYYDWRFGKILYHKRGSGSPILLIHDLNVCSSSYEWHKTIDRLSRTNTVYTLDLLGCGLSDKPNITYTNYLYVQFITDFIKHIIGEKTDVIAVGESASFTLMACANDNTIIDKVIMVNPENLVELAKIPTKRTKIQQQLIAFPVIGTFLYNLLINKNSIEKAFNLNYFYDHNLVTDEILSTYVESAHRNKTDGKYLFASIKSRFTNANVMYALSHIDNSIFIIVGTGNPENALTADQYQNQMPSIEIVGINKAKHLPHLERPDEFLNQVEILFDINNLYE